jgi:peptidoglycan-N-acetylglucosamine deacetylase
MITNPVPWPNGARVAVAFTWDEDADSLLHVMHPDSSSTRVSTISLMRYGPEIGTPRIVDLCKRYGISMTFFTPAWVVERYPKAIEAMMEGGHEIAHHGYLHENPNQQTPEKELYWLNRSSDVIERITGKRPRGYRAPWFKFSKYTADYLAQEKFLYDSSLMGDDIPYVLQSRSGRVIELPMHWAMDDYPHYVQNDDLNYMMPIKSPDQAMEVWQAEFDAMWEYRGLWVTIWHPMNSGRLARCARIAKLIEYMQKKGGVWFATMEQIALHVRKCIEQGYMPRIDQLPYYSDRIPELPPELKE